MKLDINNIIKNLNTELRKEFDSYNGIFFYGSHVKGTANTDSDYDIIILFEKGVDENIENKVLDIVYEYELKYEILIDYRIYTLQDITEPVTVFRENVKKEGVYYAA
ncbi:MAG: hypothetical protein A2068_08630 [Ignavibacteria bacterium GWB2_35_6b]|nr:MAG: hypothetical protein A2068_08630 [Ignavibacteria bacterium GWB2_35_6b]